MSQGCIFCGGKPLTRTHVFRKGWLNKIAPSTNPYVHRHERIGQRSFDRTWETSTFDLSPRCACDPCNSGWMDRMDRAVEPLIEPCVLGLPQKFSRVADHALIAMWATVISLLLDRVQETPVVPTTRSRSFFEQREPLPGTHVWLAATPNRELVFKMNQWPRTGIYSGSLRLYYATFRINRLVVQAVVPPDGTAEEITFERSGNAPLLQKIWPSPLIPVSWPPIRAIPEDELLDFANAFID